MRAFAIILRKGVLLRTMLKKLILTFAALILLLSLVASTLGCACGGEITIGAVMDITGVLSGMAPDIRDSAVMAVNEINAAGGINGKELKLVVEDGATDPTTGIEAVKKLVEVNGVKVVIGPMTATSTMAAGSYVGEKKVVLISPSATSPLIANQTWRQFVFRTVPLDDFQGAAMSQLAIEGGYQRAVTIVVDNQYGVGVENIVKDRLKDKIQILTSIRYDPTKLDYLTELQLLKDANPDVVIHCGYSDDSQILYKQALQLGLDKAQWITSEGVYSSQTLDMPEAAQFMAKAVIGVKLTASGSAYDKFVEDFKAEFGHPPGVYADYSYDAVKLAALAIKQAGYKDGAVISAALKKLGNGYAGVSGTITFANNGDRLGGIYEVWKVVNEDGQYNFQRIKVISL
jgi:ABC-type branched-subunit amino acid transport system substrate-binding protein